MKSFKVNNLRSLVDVGKIQIAPITIFLGKNSSGKSTLIRCFPLLKQTLEVKTSEPILWYGNYVDFGSFEEASNNSELEDGISFSYEFEVDKHRFDNYSFRRDFLFNDDFNKVNKKTTHKITLEIKIDVSKERVAKVCINVLGNKIIIQYGENGYAKLYINDETYDKGEDFKFQIGNLIPKLYIHNKKSERKINFYNKYFLDIDFENMFLKKIMRIFGVELTKRLKSVKNYFDDPSFKEINKLVSEINSRDVLRNNIKKLDKDIFKSEDLEKILSNQKSLNDINNLIVAYNIVEIIELSNDCLKEASKNIYYSKPLRADVNRYYRVQGLNVSDISPSGENIPMFLNSLTAAQLRKFGDFTQTTFGFKYLVSPHTGHVSLKIQYENDESSVNIADVGVGYSQVLPILATLWLISENKTFRSIYSSKMFVIEQPELHLHPAFQSQLIELFLSVAKNHNIKMIFETHSETIISKLGLMIAEEKMSNADVKIYIFDKEQNKNTTISEVGFSKKGKLENWPIGFFLE